LCFRTITGLLQSGHCRNESHEGDIHTDNLQRSPAADAPLEGHDLAAGLMLVRASTLKMIRLQLAIERRDRRGVLEAVDELVELDTRLQECLAGVPGLGEQMLGLETERATLNREKLTLVSGVTGPADRPRSRPAERPCFAFEETAAPAAHVQDAVEIAPPPEAAAPHAFARAERPRGSYTWAAVLLVVISVCAGEAYLLGGSEVLARLTSAAGAFQ
jgi:hypothetical protein